jgi:hypothetical protein
MHEKALPLLSFMEYLALEVTKSKVLVAKARSLKGIALAEIGYINEAYQILLKLFNKKDNCIMIRESEY